MFREPSKKLKVMAYLVPIIMALAGVILGWEVKLGGSYVVGCLCVAAVFYFVGWVTGVFIYGFAKLIEDTSDIRAKLYESKKD